MEPPPADDDAADAHQGLVDVVPLLVADPQPSELVQQRQRLLHHVAEHPSPLPWGVLRRAIPVAIPRADSRIRCGSES